MKLNSKLLFFFICSFSLINIIDFITLLFIKPGESNPLYILTNSIWSVLILKVVINLIIFYVYFYNKYDSRFWYFTYVYLLIIGSLMLGFGVISNIIGIMNPQMVATAAQLSSTQKINYYLNVVSYLFIIPYFIAMFAFKIYDITEKKIRYKGDNYEKNKY